MEFSCEMVKVDLLGWRRCRIYETNIENELMQLPNNLRLKRSSRDTLCLLYLLLQIIFYNQLSHRKVRSQKVLLYYARSGAIKWFLYLNGIAFNVADSTSFVCIVVSPSEYEICQTKSTSQCSISSHFCVLVRAKLVCSRAHPHEDPQ